MEIIFVSLAAGIVLLLGWPQATSAVSKEDMPKTNTDFRTKVWQALLRNDLGGIPPEFLFVMSDLETGGGYSNKGLETFAQTQSLFNRHKGSGRGYWTGRTYNAGPGDSDLRVYSDMDQSIKDIIQLLRDDGFYHDAYAHAIAGDAKGFFAGLAAKGYSTQPDYLAALNSRYNEVA